MDNGPTALFDSYESDFKQITASINSKLDGDAKGQTGGERAFYLCRRVRCTHCCGRLGVSDMDQE